MILLKMKNKIRRDSKQRPKSLILPIPAQIRDTMKFEHGTPVTWTVCSNEEKNELKIIIQKEAD